MSDRSLYGGKYGSNEVTNGNGFLDLSQCIENLRDNLLAILAAVLNQLVFVNSDLKLVFEVNVTPRVLQLLALSYALIVDLLSVGCDCRNPPGPGRRWRHISNQGSLTVACWDSPQLRMSRDSICGP